LPAALDIYGIGLFNVYMPQGFVILTAHFGGVMKAAFYTLGCKVNQYETQLMEQKLAGAGFEIVSPEEFADVYVVNSCTVTAESDRKTRQILRRLKAINPQAVAVLSGCFPQSSPDRARGIPEADVIAGTKERADITSLVTRALETGSRVMSVAPFDKNSAEDTALAEGFNGRTRAFVKIEDGCVSFCSYCIIPYARGPVRSKPVDAVRDEIAGLAGAGYKEAVLVGINLSSYGTDYGSNLIEALRAACDTGINRVRLGSLEPNIITPEFIECVLSLPNFCPQFHLSLQSGCDKTLSRMNRRYTQDKYRSAVLALRQAIPDCAITTDIIVGFPGETQDEFAQSLEFAKEMNFSQAHIFAYSKRSGTKAAEMPDQIPKAEKARRSRIMIETCDVSKEHFLQNHIGKTLPVLFETGENGGFEGFAPDYTKVIVKSGADLHGKIIDTLITECDSDVCFGTIG
jgi:threonylcarbamoyladenosine tRNA methylthiotransferase MtaB